YKIAFGGYAVVKYRDNPNAVALAETELKQAQQAATTLAAEAEKLQKQGDAAAKEAVAKAKTAQAAVTKADKQLQRATFKAKPKDIVDIIFSRPISIRVNPAKKAK
ncbi:MAG TPA: serine protease, partial [Planctomycetaceae bacterium]|nr:serine protease [Planctomycetaceae bacterium]